MNFVIIAAILTSQLALTPATPVHNLNSRIVGGKPSIVARHPYAAAIYHQTASGSYFCGGALINNQYILTASQCVDSATGFTILVGSTSLTKNDPNRLRLSTTQYIQHENYNPDTLVNDVALIRLNQPITLTEFIQPIILPDFNIQNYAVVTAIGWGQVSDSESGLSDALQEVELTILPNVECQKIYGTAVGDNMVCVAGNSNEGSCRGDNGGPLIQYRNNITPVHVGISSFISYNGCETADPSGYTRTYGYIDWINDNIANGTVTSA